MEREKFPLDTDNFPYDTGSFPYDTEVKMFDKNQVTKGKLPTPEDSVDQSQIVKKTLKESTTNHQKNNHKHILSSKKNAIINKENKYTQTEENTVCNKGAQMNNNQTKNAQLAKYLKQYKNNVDVELESFYKKVLEAQKKVKEKAMEIAKLDSFENFEDKLKELKAAYKEYKGAYENVIKYETKKTIKQNKAARVQNNMHKKNIRLIKQSQKVYLQSKNVLNSLSKNLVLYDKFKQSDLQKK